MYNHGTLVTCTSCTQICPVVDFYLFSQHRQEGLMWSEFPKDYFYAPARGCTQELTRNQRTLGEKGIDLSIAL